MTSKTHAPIGETPDHAERFLRSALPAPYDVYKNKQTGEPTPAWVPTVVNPAPVGTMLEKGLFWFHIGVWVAALVMSSVANFGAAEFMSNSSNASYDGGVGGGPASGDPSDYAGITDTTRLIGILGGVSSILGVLILLGAAAMYDAEDFASSTSMGIGVNVAIQFLTLFGTVCSAYIFSQAALVPDNWFFMYSLITVIVMGYAQVLLYCTSSAIGVAALPRAFIPSLATAVQLVSAIAVNSGDFAPAATSNQKAIAHLVWIFTLVALAGMFLLRSATKPGGYLSRYSLLGSPDDPRGVIGISNIKNRPFLRSLYLTPFLASGILSVFKLSFVKIDPNPTSYMFAFFGMMLNFSIISVVFNPSAELIGIDAD